MALTYPTTSSSSLGFSGIPRVGDTTNPPVPSQPTDPYEAFRTYSSMFGAPTALDPDAVAARIQSYVSANMPTITAPQIPQVQVNVPGGLENLGANIFESQFGPVSRELQRQSGAATDTLNSNLANAGLADSGVGVGAVAKTQDEYALRQEAAAREIAAGAGAAETQARLAIGSQQATIDMQRNLAQAGFDYESQVQNAQNILQGNLATAQGYLQAIGLSADVAAQYRAGFLSFLDSTERSRLAGDQFRLATYSALLDATLKRAALDEQKREFNVTNTFNYAQLEQKATADKQDFYAAMGSLKEGQAAFGYASNLFGPAAPNVAPAFQSAQSWGSPSTGYTSAFPQGAPKGLPSGGEQISTLNTDTNMFGFGAPNPRQPLYQVTSPAGSIF